MADYPVKLPVPIRARYCFDDVSGLDDLKETLREEVIYPMTHPGLSNLYKQRIGSGVLLYGPPGCGKTYVAEALAGELGWPLINASCGHMIARYAGQTENNIHVMFERCREFVKYRKEGIILFLDEIDALGRRRDQISSGDASYGMIVATILSELDGISSNDKIFVIGATNAPWSVDPALKRPGRFDACIFVPPPDKETRVALFKKYASGLPLSEDVDFTTLAEWTNTYSSVDVRELCDAAAEIPWKEAIKTKTARKVAMCDFAAALKKAKSSIVEWYTLVRKSKVDAETDLIFPELSSSTKEFFDALNSAEKEKKLKGYG